MEKEKGSNLDGKKIKGGDTLNSYLIVTPLQHVLSINIIQKTQLQPTIPHNNIHTNITKRVIRKRLHYIEIKVNECSIELREDKISIQGKDIHMY